MSAKRESPKTGEAPYNVSYAEETLISALMDNIPDGIYFKDLQSRFIRINQAQARHINLKDPAEALGKTDFDFFSEEHARPAFEDEQRIIRTGQPIVNLEEKEVFPDGRVAWVSTTKMPLRDPNGQIIGTFGVTRNITDLKMHQLAQERLTVELNRRALQLEIAAEVSRAASGTLDLNELVPQVVNLIRDRFNLYYVGLFLLEGKEPFAILQAGTGDAGQQMVRQGHRLEVGGQSAIGRCIANRKVHKAFDSEAVRFANPFLPDTRTELGLPLIARGQVIGAITVQSEQEAAFSDNDITVMQTLADQLANAIENARLFTARQIAEDALRDSELLNTSFLESMNFNVFRKDLEGRYTYANESFCKTLNVTLGRVIGITDFELSPKETAEKYQSDDQKVVETGKPLEVIEEHVLTDSPDKRYIQTLKAPIRNTRGEVVGIQGAFWDVSSTYQAEEALRRERQALRTLIDTIPDRIYFKDANSRFVVANIAVAQHMGAQSATELIGKNDFDFYPRDLAEKYFNDEQTLMKSGQPLYNHEEPSLDAAGNSGWMTTTKVPLLTPDGKISGLVGVGRDITTQKAAQAERERLLAEVERRAVQLQTASEISRAASSMLDENSLTQQAVNLIRDRFDLYYAGLFLIDRSGEGTKEANRWAVLRAGTGEAGATMLAQNHKLEIKGTSMIGWCVLHKEARVALNVELESVRFRNPLLPLTRSELALPLVSRSEAIGALTIQSTQKEAFSPEDITIFQSMADQLANAIANARLYEQTQNALKEMEATYRRYIAQSWIDFLRQSPETGYRSTPQGMEPLGSEILPEVNDVIRGLRSGATPEHPDAQKETLVMPIKLRDQAIGAMGFKLSRPDQQWGEDEFSLIEAITEQFALAAENMRLLDETQRRAARERLIGEVTGRMRESLDMSAVLRTASRELATALQLAAINVQLGTDLEETSE